MTNAIESEQLTRVGPGTVMGDLMRQYWLPAAMSSELVARRRSDAADAAGREADRVPRQRGPRRRDGPSLPASLRVAVLRPQRGRTASAASITAGNSTSTATASTCRTCRRIRTSGRRSRPRPTRSPSAPASSGSIWASAQEAPPLPEIEATLLPESELADHVRAARVQLAAGARRRHRHVAFRLSACRLGAARAGAIRTTG